MEASRLHRFVKNLELVIVGILRFYIPASGKREALSPASLAWPHLLTIFRELGLVTLAVSLLLSQPDRAGLIAVTYFLSNL